MVLGIYNILKLLLIMTIALRNDRSCVIIIIITILLFFLFIFFYLQTFPTVPHIQTTVQHGTLDQLNDAMDVWLESVSTTDFEVCLRESRTFSVPHSNLYVVCQYLVLVRITKGTILNPVWDVLNRRSSCLISKSDLF